MTKKEINKLYKELECVIDEYKDIIYDLSCEGCGGNLGTLITSQEEATKEMYESIDRGFDDYIIPKIENGEIIINKKNYEDTEMGKEERIDAEKSDYLDLSSKESIKFLTEDEFKNLIEGLKTEIIEDKETLEEIKEKQNPELEI